MRKTCYPLLEVLVLGILLSAYPMVSVSAMEQSKAEEEDWAEIARLHDRGWKEIKRRDFVASETTFRLATGRLKMYRDIYLRSEYGIRFLRATYRLGYFAELGNDDYKAKLFYDECLIHPLINSTGAVADGEAILQRAKERLKIVERRLQESADQSKAVPPRRSTKGGSANRPEKEYPRISAKGGSKGGEKNLPALSSDLRP